MSGLAPDRLHITDVHPDHRPNGTASVITVAIEDDYSRTVLATFDAAGYVRTLDEDRAYVPSGCDVVETR